MKNNKTFLYGVISVLLFTACSQPASREEMTKEIFETEKAFEKMAKDKSISEAFYYYADEKAVIKREHDTLIDGKENIRAYYEARELKNASVEWTPDFIEVSESGDLGYTYGQYLWTIISAEGDTSEFKGVFHTVWKRQDDGSWKYVWD